MKRCDIHKFHFQNSGPGSKPAGAALGRAAATIRIFPAPLPGRTSGRQQSDLHLPPGRAPAAGERLPPASSRIAAFLLTTKYHQRPAG